MKQQKRNKKLRWRSWFDENQENLSRKKTTKKEQEIKTNKTKSLMNPLLF